MSRLKNLFATSLLFKNTGAEFEQPCIEIDQPRPLLSTILLHFKQYFGIWNSE